MLEGPPGVSGSRGVGEAAAVPPVGENGAYALYAGSLPVRMSSACSAFHTKVCPLSLVTTPRVMRDHVAGLAWRARTSAPNHARRRTVSSGLDGMSVLLLSAHRMKLEKRSVTFSVAESDIGAVDRL